MKTFVLIALALVAVVAANVAVEERTFSTDPDFLPNFGRFGSKQWVNAGRAPKSAPHTLVFAVRHSNRDLLDSMLAEVSDPSNPKYTDYLTHEELALFTDKHDTAAVTDFLSANKVSFQVSKNGDWVIASLTIEAAEKLLKTAEFHAFKSAKLGKTIYRTPSITLPARVAEAVDYVEHTIHFPSDVAPTIDHIRGKSASNPGDTYPAVISKYYEVEQIAGSPQPGSSMSVFEALGQNVDPADLATFQKTYGLPNEPVAKFVGPNNPDECLIQPNACSEATLDCQYIASTAQKIPLTYWSIKSTDATPFLDWALAVANTSDAELPKVTSISYGGVENTEPMPIADRFNVEVQKLGLRGASVFVSSGDDGVANFPARSNPEKCGFFPSFPAACPSVTAVGATMGIENAKPEVVCSSDTGSIITSGGGFSNYWPTPSWQAEAVKNFLSTTPKLPPAGSFNATGRGYPDLAAAGNNFEIAIDGRTAVGSGTSASAPVVAAMVALVNDARLAAGKKTLGFLNPALYSAPADIFHDITSGDNRCAAGPNPDCCPHGFYAQAGWDAAGSGLGSPRFPKFKAYLLSL